MTKELKDEYPAVELAYDIAVGSYDVLGKRFDSLDGRLQTAVAFFASSTATVLAIAAGLKLNFHSKWFYFAIGFMALTVIAAVVVRLDSDLKVLDPSKLNTDEWLKCSEWEFKNLVIQAAAIAFVKNNKLVMRRWRWLMAIILTFSLGVLCLTVWLIRLTASA
jgi:hypothetical protein